MAGSRDSDASLDKISIYFFVNEMRKETCLFLNPTSSLTPVLPVWPRLDRLTGLKWCLEELARLNSKTVIQVHHSEAVGKYRKEQWPTISPIARRDHSAI